MTRRGEGPSRNAPSSGIGYAYTSVQEPETIFVQRLTGDSQAFEAFYNLSVIPAVELTFDVQWADSALQRVDSPVSVGFRLNVRL